MAEAKAKKKAISPSKWADVMRRYIVDGESASVLARELGVSETAVRKRAGSKRFEVKDIANQIVSAEQQYERLDKGSKSLVDDMAAQLRAVNSGLMRAAVNGANSSARLSAYGVKQLDDIDKLAAANPNFKIMDAQEELQAFGVVTKLGNDAAQLSVQLINANKESLKAQEDKEVAQPISVMIEVQNARNPSRQNAEA